MREINKIIIHCSAIKLSQDIGSFQINEWHKKQGWSGLVIILLFVEMAR